MGSKGRRKEVLVRRVVSLLNMSIFTFTVAVIVFFATHCSSSLFLEAIDDTLLHKINWAGPLPEDSLVRLLIEYIIHLSSCQLY